MINIHESMGAGPDRTRDPWICSQTRICCQTRYRLRYAARCHTDDDDDDDNDDDHFFTSHTYDDDDDDDDDDDEHFL